MDRVYFMSLAMDLAKEAAFSELTAEINSYCFNELAKAVNSKKHTLPLKF